MPRPPWSESARRKHAKLQAISESPEDEVYKLKDEIVRLRAALHKVRVEQESGSTLDDEEDLRLQVVKVENAKVAPAEAVVAEPSAIPAAPPFSENAPDTSRDEGNASEGADDAKLDLEAVVKIDSLRFDDDDDDEENFDVQSERRCKGLIFRISHSRAFSVISNLALFVALFGGNVAVLFNIPDDPSIVILDNTLLFCMLVFSLDILLKVLLNPYSYMTSLFFCLDIVGTVSISFDISYMLGFLGNMDSGMDTSLARSARAAKVGARAGRMLKLMRLLTIWMSGNAETKIEATNILEAKVLSKRMVNVLSTKVAILTIVLVLGTPLFSLTLYPLQDLSMQAWAESLEAEYNNAVEYLKLQPDRTSSTHFELAVSRLREFYSNLDYAPFRLDGWCEHITVGGRKLSIPGQSLISLKEPQRSGNILTIRVPQARADCKQDALIHFDFTIPSQTEAGVDIAVIIFIILVMGAASQDLNKLIKVMLVQPLEGMLTHAVYILTQFNISIEGSCHTELDVLSQVLAKFSRVTDLASQQAVITSADMSELDDESKGVLSDMLAFQVERASRATRYDVRKGTKTRFKSLKDGRMKVSSWTDGKVVASWDLDVLSYDTASLNELVKYLFWDSELREVGARSCTDEATFGRFLEVTRSSYNDLPYHCYQHAVDVLHAVYRFQCLTQAVDWMGAVEQYALLVAGLAHDLGHFGSTNPFLVETQNAIALQYNDASPLENMHSAKLFAICSREHTNIFNGFEKPQFALARKVIISAILHTDNAHHFETVKRISHFYETVSDICDAQATKNTLDLSYQEEVLMARKLEWCQMFLHLGDISNPLKPFHMCASWAARVLDEFFAQGDEEKALGLPVGMLNDREKVNRPGSQHGFVTLLVAPFVIGSVRIFPCLHPLSTQMVSNAKEWWTRWIEDSHPSEQEIARREADIKKLQETSKQLTSRANRTRTMSSGTSQGQSQAGTQAST